MKRIGLILEGTYPYVTGGVSSFIHQLISATPNYNYVIVYIGSNIDHFKEKKYPLPPNVENISEVYLFDHDYRPNNSTTKGAVDLDIIKEFHHILKNQKQNLPFNIFEQIYHRFFNLDSRIIDPFDLFFNKESWNIIQNFYLKNDSRFLLPPFIEYFYNWRFSHYPLFKILTTPLPKADIYHSMSTGYAGMLGSVAALKYRRPYFLTEHGIYSHEREIEIAQANWLNDYGHDLYIREDEINFKRWWTNLFHFMSKASYHYASSISTLFEGNRQKQILYGAPSEKTHLIPNGIKLSKFECQKNLDPKVISIGLIGRIVPIKDIKTFIKAIYFLKSSIANLKIYLIGPTDEDEGYYQECLTLIHIFGLDSIINFTGKADVKNYYPLLDLVVLSSISEGQPLVILEAFAAKIPVLATEVGACRELIYGKDDEDKKIGQAGAIIPLGQPEIMASTLNSLLSNRDRLLKMGECGHVRVKRYYQEETMIERYLTIYDELLKE